MASGFITVGDKHVRRRLLGDTAGGRDASRRSEGSGSSHHVGEAAPADRCARLFLRFVLDGMVDPKIWQRIRLKITPGGTIPNTILKRAASQRCRASNPRRKTRNAAGLTGASRAWIDSPRVRPWLARREGTASSCKGRKDYYGRPSKCSRCKTIVRSRSERCSGG